MSKGQMPIANENQPTWDLVIEEYQKRPYHDFQQEIIIDMEERDKLGEKRYNTRLQPFNGLNSLEDLYEELLDSCAYCRNAIEEGSDIDDNLLDVSRELFNLIDVVKMVMLSQENYETV